MCGSPLHRLLELVGLRYLDFWSLDVGGAEVYFLPTRHTHTLFQWNVLQTFNFEAVSVHYLLVARGNDSDTVRIASYLASKGFERREINAERWCKTWMVSINSFCYWFTRLVDMYVHRAAFTSSSLTLVLHRRRQTCCLSTKTEKHARNKRKMM